MQTKTVAISILTYVALSITPMELFLSRTMFNKPWRRGAADIASASGIEDPGSNPATV
jgi:hypothetical protein